MTGRTLAMVKALPDTGAVVVVHSSQMRDYLIRMIGDVRGPNVLKNTRVIIIRDRADTHLLRGQRRPTFVDHAFWNTASSEMRHIVDIMVNRRNEHTSERLASIAGRVVHAQTVAPLGIFTEGVWRQIPGKDVQACFASLLAQAKSSRRQ